MTHNEATDDSRASRVEAFATTWIDRLGNVSGALTIVAVVCALLVLVGVPAAFVWLQNELCESPCEDQELEQVQARLAPYVVASSILMVVVLVAVFVSAALWSAVLGHRVRRRRWERRMGPRLEQAKQWYAEAHIEKAEFRRLFQQTEALTSGRFAGERAIVAGQFLLRTGMVALVCAVILGIVTWVETDDLRVHGGSRQTLEFLIPGLVVCSVLAAAFLPAGPTVRARGRRQAAQVFEDMRAWERRTLDRLHEQSSTTPR